MATSSAELRTRVKQLEENVEKLKLSQSASLKRRTELEAERKNHVMAARLQKDTKAQAQMLKIDVELESARRDAVDDESALTEMSRELIQTRDALALAEWEEERAGVRGLFTRLIAEKHEERLAAAVENVLKIYAELESEYREAAATLAKFDPSLRNSADDIRRLAEKHSELMSCRFTSIGMSTEINWAFLKILRQQDFVTNAGLTFDRAIMDIGALEPSVTLRSSEEDELAAS